MKLLRYNREVGERKVSGSRNSDEFFTVVVMFAHVRRCLCRVALKAAVLRFEMDGGVARAG
jgi:hypothetical protein